MRRNVFWINAFSHAIFFRSRRYLGSTPSEGAALYVGPQTGTRGRGRGDVSPALAFSRLHSDAAPPSTCPRRAASPRPGQVDIGSSCVGPYRPLGAGRGPRAAGPGQPAVLSRAVRPTARLPCRCPAVPRHSGQVSSHCLHLPVLACAALRCSGSPDMSMDLNP